MVTKISIPTKTRLLNAAWRAKFAISLSVGRHAPTAAAIRRSEERRLNARLTSEELDALVAAQVSRVTADASRRSRQLTDADLSAPIRHMHANAATLALRATANASSFVNIGARVDNVCAYLAPLYPKVSFISVDLQPNLREHNAFLPQSANWSFMTGYALDLMERGALSGDVALFTSTATLFPAGELDEYAAALARSFRSVLLNEPWWLGQRPESLTSPICAGLHGNYHHNYSAVLERHGFTIVSSEIVPTPVSGLSCLQLIAVH